MSIRGKNVRKKLVSAKELIKSKRKKKVKKKKETCGPVNTNENLEDNNTKLKWTKFSY